MKIGDIVQYKYPPSDLKQPSLVLGTVLEFPEASHPKEFQKVKVMTDVGIQVWVMQFCEVVSILEDQLCEACGCTPCDCHWGIQ